MYNFSCLLTRKTATYLINNLQWNFSLNILSFNQLKNIIHISLTISLATTLLAANLSSPKFPWQNKKKQLANIENIRKYNAIGTILNNKTFVVEAQYQKDKQGNRTYVTPNLNFVKVDSDEAVLQIGSGTSSMQNNGLGGTMAKGTLTGIEIKDNDKKLRYYLKMTFLTFSVNMKLDYNGWTEATVTRLNSARITYEGNLVSLKNSKILEGNASY